MNWGMSGKRRITTTSASKSSKKRTRRKLRNTTSTIKTLKWCRSKSTISLECARKLTSKYTTCRMNTIRSRSRKSWIKVISFQVTLLDSTVSSNRCFKVSATMVSGTPKRDRALNLTNSSQTSWGTQWSTWIKAVQWLGSYKWRLMYKQSSVKISLKHKGIQWRGGSKNTDCRKWWRSSHQMRTKANFI